MDLASEVHTVELAGHLNVREQHSNIETAFQNSKRRIDVGGFDDAISLIFKDIGRVHPQQGFVIDHEDDGLSS